jgi:hypothetical protein
METASNLGWIANKFTNEGAVRVNVLATRGLFEIRIIETGMGIPVEEWGSGDDYLAKPYETDVLENRIKTLLNRSLLLQP